MSTPEPPQRAAKAHLHLTGSEHAVTNLELFFDLVFVFALTQVTALIAATSRRSGCCAAYSCWR